MKKSNISFLLLLVILLLPLYVIRLKIGPFRTNIFEVSIYIFFVLFVIERLFSKSFAKINFGGTASLVFILISLLSIWQSNELITGLGIFKGWFLAPFLLYVMVINLFDKKNLPQLSVPLFVSLIVVSLWVFFQKNGYIGQLFYQVGDVSFDQYLIGGRYFGPFESPNFLAMFITPVFLISLPIFGYLKNVLLKIFIAMLLPLPIYAVYLTGSRAGQFTFALSLVVFIVLLVFPTIKKYLLSLPVIKVIGLVFANILYFYFFLRIKFPTGAGSDKIRQEIYNYSIGLLKTDWLFGIGLGNFQDKIRALSTHDFSFINFGLPYALHPHNLMMAIWLNLGVFGLLSFLFVIGNFVKKIISSPPSLLRASAGGAMVAILVHGLFDTTYFKNDLSAIFWLLIAFSIIINLKVSTADGKD